MVIDPETVFNRLGKSNSSIWSLLLNSGYMTGSRVPSIDYMKLECNLHITNYETNIMFHNMFVEWFQEEGCNYNKFLKALMADNLKEMNLYINEIALAVFSSFDTGKNPSLSPVRAPERFYHGFILGLMADLRNRYIITSNRESGFGRYDIMLEPVDKEKDNGVIIEFKVYDSEEENDLKETVGEALRQIEEKKYAADLISRGVPEDRIRKYGFAFCGKKILIGDRL